MILAAISENWTTRFPAATSIFAHQQHITQNHAGLAERSIASDCKSDVFTDYGGSNPSPCTKEALMKRDHYNQARGGWSRVLDVSCEKCSQHICFYQKDGPGPLKRMYIDRIIDVQSSTDRLICDHCQHELGVATTYEKEQRPAYRLFQDAVTKKIVAQSNLEVS
jgi:hypothetical protein